jgi:hypothetical protein
MFSNQIAERNCIFVPLTDDCKINDEGKREKRKEESETENISYPRVPDFLQIASFTHPNTQSEEEIDRSLYLIKKLNRFYYFLITHIECFSN